MWVAVTSPFGVAASKPPPPVPLYASPNPSIHPQFCAVGGITNGDGGLSDSLRFCLFECAASNGVIFERDSWALFAVFEGGCTFSVRPHVGGLSNWFVGLRHVVYGFPFSIAFRRIRCRGMLKNWNELIGSKINKRFLDKHLFKLSGDDCVLCGFCSSYGNYYPHNYILLWAWCWFTFDYGFLFDHNSS